MSIPRRIGYAVLSVDGNETSEVDVESLGTAAADDWDEAARVPNQLASEQRSEASSASSFSAVSVSDAVPSPNRVWARFDGDDEVVHLLSAIHTALRRLVQQQTAVIDGLKLLHADAAEHQKEALIRFKRISRNTERYAYADSECSTVVGAPAVQH